jgi:hypothetical protein
MKEAVMRKHFDKFAAAWSAFLVLLLLIPASMFSSQAPDPQDQFKDFQARIQKYVELQKKAASSVPAIPKDVTDPNVIARHQQQMGEAIRALRPGAMPGEIFTPGVRQLIINTVKQKLEGSDGAAARATVLGEGNPKSGESAAPVKLAINASYPTAAPLSTVPPSLLIALPTLPREVEYRFVGRTLILRDTQANLIVDMIPNVFESK